MTPEELRALIGDAPEETALLFDFDGVLAPIVDEPSAARPAPGAVDLMVELGERFARVAVISGRPRAFLEAFLPPSIDLSALYGLESRVGGVARDHPDADRWRSVIEDVVDTSDLGDGAVLEPKGLSLTVHYRQAPELADAVYAWAERVASSTGLVARPAKASVELHPPVPVDKGTVVAELADGCRTVVFTGDDVGDLPAFAVLDRLRDAGRSTAKVVSNGPDLPPEVAAVADLVVDGPEAVVELFSGLA